ncbi:MAG: DUF3011 domain-containing protein [Bdellovibrionota bacterium]
MFKVFSLTLALALSTLSIGITASADWQRPPPPPPGFDHGGPGWDHGGHGGPGWDHGGHGGPGWDHGGPGHGGWGPGGPGWGHQPPPPPPPPTRQMYVQCASGGYSFNRCLVNGYVRQAWLTNQESSASCNLGQTWGYEQNSIWVDKGCRGTFLVELY